MINQICGYEDNNMVVNVRSIVSYYDGEHKLSEKRVKRVGIVLRFNVLYYSRVKYNGKIKYKT